MKFDVAADFSGSHGKRQRKIWCNVPLGASLPDGLWFKVEHMSTNTTPRQPLSPDRSRTTERTVADLGGLADAGPVIREEYDASIKDKRIDAMSMLLRQVDDRLTSDTSRRAQEELDEAIYDNIHYYDRWLIAMRTNLINLGYLTEAEIAARMAEIKVRQGRS
jgi:hypothetical protein